jgi:hypothetical protein
MNEKETKEHLDNILALLSIDDYDEEVMSHLRIYIESRGLLKLNADQIPQHAIDTVNKLLEKQKKSPNA